MTVASALLSLSASFVKARLGFVLFPSWTCQVSLAKYLCTETTECWESCGARPRSAGPSVGGLQSCQASFLSGPQRKQEEQRAGQCGAAGREVYRPREADGGAVWPSSWRSKRCGEKPEEDRVCGPREPSAHLHSGSCERQLALSF